MKKSIISWQMLLPTMVVALIIGVVFTKRSYGLGALGDLVALLPNLAISITALLVGIATAYTSLKVLNCNLAYFGVAIFGSIQAASLACLIDTLGTQGFDYSIVVALMSSSWWVFLYLIAEIE